VGITNDEVLKAVEDVKNEQKEQRKEMVDIKVVLAKNTTSLEEHMQQTRLIKGMVMPLHEERLRQEGIKAYKESAAQEKKQKRQDLLYKLKLPVAIVAALGAIITLVAWIGGMF